jgi:hypothetical protein
MTMYETHGMYSFTSALNLQEEHRDLDILANLNDAMETSFFSVEGLETFDGMFEPHFGAIQYSEDTRKKDARIVTNEELYMMGNNTFALPCEPIAPPSAPVCTTPELYRPTRQILIDDDNLMKTLSEGLGCWDSKMSSEARRKHRSWAAKKKARVHYGRRHVYANKASVARKRLREGGKFETTEMRMARLVAMRQQDWVRVSLPTFTGPFSP